MEVKNTIIIITCLLLTKVLFSQEISWKESSIFTFDSYTSTVSNQEGLLPNSYLLSESVLDYISTGYLEATQFKIDGTTIGPGAEIGSFMLFFTFEETFSLASIYENSYSITYDGLEHKIFINGLEGNIDVISNVSLSTTDIFRIEKTETNKILLKYNSNEYLVNNNILADGRISLFSTTKNLSFQLNSIGFKLLSDEPAINVLDTDRNWMSVKNYDNKKNINGASVTFYDDLAKPTQSQSRDFKTNRTWIAETLYDYQGRPALNSFSEPIAGTPYHFSFKNDFIKKWDGSTYDKASFETNPESPETTSGETMGSLGWYYSDNNTLEPFQDKAEGRPYNRTLYDDLNPGLVRASIGGKILDANGNGIQDNLLDKYPQGFSYTLPAAQELYYVFGKNYFNGEISSSGEKFLSNYFKTVVIDAQGNENVQFSDSEGKILATARSGGYTAGPEYEVVSVIGEQGFIDVHIPKNITNIQFLSNSSDYTIYDLRSGQIIPNNQMIGGNVYRIQASALNTSNDIFINSSGLLTTQIGAKGIRYRVNYYDYSLNYYDKVGNLKKTIQPKGFNNSCLENPIQSNVSHSMSSYFSYNASGELKTSTSPDEGGSEFIYREDGQIRFSRNSHQSEIGEFSYTNYDSKGRPVESGVYFGSPDTYDQLTTQDASFETENNVSSDQGAVSNNSESAWIDTGFISTINTGEGNFNVSFQFNQNEEGVVGVSANNLNGDYKTVEYAMYFINNQITILNNGSTLSKNSTYYNANDTFSIQRLDNVLYFKKNTEILYTITPWEDSATFFPELWIDGALYSSGAIFSNIQIEILGEKIADIPPTYIPLPDPNYELDESFCKEQIFSFYDIPDTVELQTTLYGKSDIPQRLQRFVAGNVSKSWTKKPETSATWYSYDIYGRVEWMVQFINGLGAKTIDYVYDDATGAISKVIYQRDDPNDKFVHKYIYNDVGQLTVVETSRDNINFIEHAKYLYYETGELKRIELAEGLQGIDYVYTLSGQLKAINHPGLSNSEDPGEDENDAFGVVLDYFQKDYTRAGSYLSSTTSGNNRFDGNIKATRWGTQGLTVNNGYLYDYDKNNWLKSATFGSFSNNNFNANANGDYNVFDLEYDPNGNLTKLNRNKSSANGDNSMDMLFYNYKSNKNQLSSVSDLASAIEDVGDIKDQDPDNYTYNEIGQLIKNEQDKISYDYFASGLIKSVFSTEPGSRQGVSFKYNDRGQRVEKTSYTTSGTRGPRTIYVRDASGMPMAIYNLPAENTLPVTTVEYPIYGLSRLGIADHNNNFKYQLTDHLGNVRAVIQRNGSLAPVLFEDFENGVVPAWETPENTILAIVDGRLKVSALNNVPNPVSANFSVIAGNTYSIKFEVDLDETNNNLRFYIQTSGFTTPLTSNMASENGVYTFNYTAIQTGTAKLVFDLNNNLATIQNNYYLDNVRITDVTTSNIPIMIAYKDYYPFGMPMPDRNVEGQYRYAYQGQEKDPETGMEAFELRLWDSRIGRWMTTDPARQHASPYLGMGNNPISRIDPDGGEDWKPEVNEDGSTTYWAEKGDSDQTFADQYGVSLKKAQKLIGSNQVIADVTSVSGQDVFNMFGTEVLKLQLSSYMATDQRVIDQFVFATQHSSSKGAFAWKATEYYGQVYDRLQTDYTYKGTICANNRPIDLSISVQWHTSQGAYFNETAHQAVFGNSLDGTIPTNGTMFGKREDITHSKIGFGYIFGGKLVWQNSGYISLLTQSKNSQALNQTVFQQFPQKNYFKTNGKGIIQY